MANYPVIPAASVDRMTIRYPKLKWPIETIQVGEAFIVPLRQKFSCRKTGDGLAITRIA